jgi:hypothetical protein
MLVGSFHMLAYDVLADSMDEVARIAESIVIDNIYMTI